MWFEEHPTNARWINFDQARKTFLNAGYYRVDLSPKLSVLALNTVVYLDKNRGMDEQGKQADD